MGQGVPGVWWCAVVGVFDESEEWDMLYEREWGSFTPGGIDGSCKRTTVVDPIFVQLHWVFGCLMFLLFGFASAFDFHLVLGLL